MLLYAHQCVAVLVLATSNGLCSWIYYDEDEAESDDDLGEESEGEEEKN